MNEPSQRVSLGEAVKVWAKVGVLGFGGPAAQIALLHREVVENRKWVGEERFLQALNYCMLLPGPEAQQLATYLGWLLHRTLGGVLAGGLFVLPGFVVILALSILYVSFRDVTAVSGMLFGLKAAVLAIVVEAVLRLGKRALKHRYLVGVSGGAFLSLWLFHVPFPVVVAAASLAGLMGRELVPAAFPDAQGAAGERDTVLGRMELAGELGHTRPSWQRLVLTAFTCLALWWGPVALAAVVAPGSVFVDEGVFFSKAAVVTFGGAYAVLAYIAQQAVETWHWLQPGEMVDGLGLAETTPGPLVLVLEFVGFLGGWRKPGGVSPLVGGVLGASITAWVTFLPCFLWIFTGAPFIERLRNNRALSAALKGISAAVVGVILNLSVWFSLHVLFARLEEVQVGAARVLVPVWSSLDVASLSLTLVALVTVFGLKRRAMEWTLAICVVLGVAVRLALK